MRLDFFCISFLHFTQSAYEVQKKYNKEKCRFFYDRFRGTFDFFIASNIMQENSKY